MRCEDCVFRDGTNCYVNRNSQPWPKPEDSYWVGSRSDITGVHIGYDTCPREDERQARLKAQLKG